MTKSYITRPQGRISLQKESPVTALPRLRHVGALRKQSGGLFLASTGAGRRGRPLPKAEAPTEPAGETAAMLRRAKLNRTF